MRLHIFTPGPAVLPTSVLAESSNAVVELNGSGMSILEISHRGKDFTEILAEAKSLVKQHYDLGDDYEVLFLQGGASMQFLMIPYNLLNGETAAYIDTGSWSSKAIKEAKLFGNIETVASSKDVNYSYIPKDISIPNEVKYLHLTSNNTIYGTQFKNYPNSPVPLIVDMSSDIFSRRIDAGQFDLLYAGAQKNLGPAGVTLVIIKKGLLDMISKELPSMMDYRVHVEKGSTFNTPPVFAIYVCLLTLRWIKQKGGLAAIEKINKEKAKILYDAIDAYPLYKGTANKEDRSTMNATFVLNKPDLENDFLNATKEAGIIGIKGHRSVGGFRASMYNALPSESVDVLVDVMKDFSTKNG